MCDKIISVLKEKEKHCQDEWQVLPPSYDCGGHNALGCRSILKGHTAAIIWQVSLSLCYLIDPQLSRPEKWWCNLLLFTRVACTVIGGLVLLHLLEATEKGLGYIYEGLDWAESCCS